MLRSYLTVIRDSFRAAMNSRVLYIVLALIALVLLVIAPFHVRQSVDSQLTRDNIPDRDRLIVRMVEEGKSGSRPAVAHIWNQLSEDLQTRLEERAAKDPDESRRDRGPGGPDGPSEFRLLIDELNGLIDKNMVYDEQVFQGKRLGKEATELLEKGTERTYEEDRRFQRLLLTSAVRRDIAAPGATQLDFYYFNWHWSFLTASTSHSTFASGVTSQLPSFFDKFVMSIGIFIAILITASIIPEMLEPGSLNLLLSKPVHRWGLMLAKYIGGCVFIFMCASLLFVGIWLWMGIQLGIWERAILLSIPTYVFVFAMYYSVSVLAGIWFRSPILCITFAVLFWAVCWGVGFGYGLLDYRHYNTAAREIVATGDDVAMVNMLQQTFVWEQDDMEWHNPSIRKASPEEQALGFFTFMDRFDELPDMPGPVVDNQQNRLLFADSGLDPAGANANVKLASSDPDESWKAASRGKLPNGTLQILYSSTLGQLAIDQTSTVFRWTGQESDDDSTKKEDKEEPKKKSKLGEQISGLVSRQKNKVDYDRIGSVQASMIQSSSAVTINQANDEIVFYSDGDVVVMSCDGDEYKYRTRAKVGDHNNAKMTAFVACGDDAIFVMLGNGRFYHLNGSDLSIIGQQDLSDRAAIRSMSASANGKHAAVTLRSGELWIYDAVNKSEATGLGINNDDIMACDFDEQSRLWVGDRFQSARCYDLNNGSEVIAREHDGGWMTSSFRYAVRPLYRIFPKPSEFYKLVSHLASSGDAKGNPDIDLTRMPHRDDPWSPLRSGIIFTAIVLAIACFLFQRQDF